MRTRIDIDKWERRALFGFFHGFAEPYHGVCVRVDCTKTYAFAKEHRFSVFLSLLHRSLAAAQEIPNFCTRIQGSDVWRYDRVNGGSVVARDNGTFGFGHYRYATALPEFVTAAATEMERVRRRDDLERPDEVDLIRYSVLPWLDFTSISHARQAFHSDDSAPQITFGKMTEAAGRRTMPVSIHVHHGLADGLHVAQFVERFQARLDAPESV